MVENFERINAMEAPSEEQRSNRQENIHDWNVVNDFEKYEEVMNI